MRALLVFLGLFWAVFASDLNLLKDEIKAQITSIDGNKIHFKILTNPKIPLKSGEIGQIVHKYNDQDSAIIGSIKFNSGEIGELSESLFLSQPFLPAPTNAPKAGDTIIFRSFNNRAFLIAPNVNSYNKASQQLKDIEILSADLLQGLLLSYGGFDPDKAFLSASCRNYNVGLLFVVLQDNISAFDCQSLVAIHKDAFSLSQNDIKNIKAPFYSRIEGISSRDLKSFFSFKESLKYFDFYNNLLKP
ncbi:MAG: plasminogen-binding N-terminal domain-containing protein [Helicobacter sp.]|nr:plasminogen-binding N-terminal domain-containing protein [Helicobacter sp.]